MAQRKALSKKLRFEVFKRDNFTCQYCGAKAPDAILEVDHITPVSKGGTNNILNLITACKGCNSGKTNIPLSDYSAVSKQRKQAEEMQERREMIKLMSKWQVELREEEDMEINEIDDLLYIFYPGNGLSENGRLTIRRLIKRFGYRQVYEAAEIAFTKYQTAQQAINKLGGICYNKKIGRGADYYR